jgi:hypothetical protein
MVANAVLLFHATLFSSQHPFFMNMRFPAFVTHFRARPKRAQRETRNWGRETTWFLREPMPALRPRDLFELTRGFAAALAMPSLKRLAPRPERSAAASRCFTSSHIAGEGRAKG